MFCTHLYDFIHLMPIKVQISEFETFVKITPQSSNKKPRLLSIILR